MRNLTLILCLLALVGAVASGVMFFVIGNSKQQLHARWQNAEGQVTATETLLASAQTSNAELTTRIPSLDTDLARAKRDLTDTRLSVEKLTQALALAEESRLTALAARESALANLTAAHTELQALREQFNMPK